MKLLKFKEFEKALKSAGGGSPRETEIMRGGDLLIKPKDIEQANKFLALNKKKMANWTVSFCYLNAIRQIERTNQNGHRTDQS